jgi:phage terminase large subunit GpA-like protein
MLDYQAQISELWDAFRISISNLKPADWAEKHRYLHYDTPFPGKYSFDKTPYLREIVNRLAADDPAIYIAVKKGAQIGFSTGVIENGIGWIISENPGNILFLTGATDLSEEAMSGKIDAMIESCGIRNLIKPNVLRKKNLRTGDTNKSKEFPGGSLIAGGAGNHKLLRQRSIKFFFVDDYDAAKQKSKESGSTKSLIEQRTAAYGDKKKGFYISTPELASTSNIEDVYKKGDQRKYFVPCPECSEMIVLEWEIQSLKNPSETAGISWKVTEEGKLITESVGYICQCCGEFFTDQNKTEMLASGEWRPTANPSEVGFYSYHLSSLYAPTGMDDWAIYVGKYLEANPVGGARDEMKHQAFVNLCLGEPYEENSVELKATQLMRNIRPYSPGIIPEALSIADGNGKIVMLTCACDLGGICNKEGYDDDVRLDYEIIAWSASGSSYSVQHGSIGTFIFRETNAQKLKPREKWTYNHQKEHNVWKELDKILGAWYPIDNTGQKMQILVTAIDTGYWTDMAFEYIDKRRHNIIGVKGSIEDKMKPLHRETKNFKISPSRNNLYILDGHNIKDKIAAQMSMRWDKDNGESQPTGFMNFPSDPHLYQFDNYFSHYEAEARVEDKLGETIVGFAWKKKNSTVQNHFFDCRYYNIAAKDIFVDAYFKAGKVKDYTWNDFVALVV